MVKTGTLKEGTQPAAAPSLYGFVKTCTDEKIIRQVLGDDLYFSLHAEASRCIEPDCPELALIYPALIFNSTERAKVAFYDTFTVGLLGDLETKTPLSWGRKLPEDDGVYYRKTATLMKWK